MYNRYVPQSDGSYRRSRMEDASQQPQRKQELQRKPEQQPRKEGHCPPSPPQEPCRGEPKQRQEPPKHQGQQVSSFLRQLLPRDFDTADLIIVLLLLLLAGDCEEDKSTAMLTLVLYLFM